MLMKFFLQMGWYDAHIDLKNYFELLNITIMSKYSIIARKDPGDANAEPKFYPILKSVDRIDTAYIGGCLKNPV